jgi:hypothetical protein
MHLGGERKTRERIAYEIFSWNVTVAELYDSSDESNCMIFDHKVTKSRDQ